MISRRIYEAIGRQFGGDEKCRVLPDVRPWVTCPCHRGEAS